MTKIHDISAIKFNSDNLILVVDGKTFQLKLSELSMKLASASDTDRNTYIISPSGYGIHWPTIDEDISINGILGNA
jgi:hypothetical protein